MEARLIVVADTHCRFDVLEAVIEHETARGPGVVAVLHCGDIGLYDEGSLERLSTRESQLIRKHRNPIEQCYPYLNGARAFDVPVYAIPGNHEDFELVKEIESGRRTLPGLHLLLPGERVKLPVGERVFEVMGLGRTLPEDIHAKNRNRAKYIADDDVEGTLAACRSGGPDILLLHQPPKIQLPGRSEFGSTVVTRLLREIAPRLTVVGHMHFEYDTVVEGARVVGAGYGVWGVYATIDAELVLSRRRAPLPPGVLEVLEGVKARRYRAERAGAKSGRQRRAARTELQLTHGEIVQHFGLSVPSGRVRRRLDRLLGDLRRRFAAGEVTREEALEAAGRLLSETASPRTGGLEDV